MTGGTLLRSPRQPDTQLVLPASLVKAGCFPAWLPGLPSASPTNQELMEAARSSCCYSNRQHWRALLKNMFLASLKPWVLPASPSPIVNTVAVFAHRAVFGCDRL